MKPLVVVMGAAASGKSLVGRLLAERLGVPFRDGDDLHPRANVEKMRAGIPLDDADRAPWLDAITDWLASHAATGGVVTCSALKRSYRDRLREADDRLRFLFLAVDPSTLRERMTERRGHFMPAELLQSQLDALQPPGAGEPDVIAVDGAADPAAIARTASGQLAAAARPLRQWGGGTIPPGPRSYNRSPKCLVEAMGITSRRG